LTCVKLHGNLARDGMLRIVGFLAPDKPKVGDRAIRARVPDRSIRGFSCR
jgi:hypothetical protein